MNLLVSYPRSGNTWIRYCIEYLTKQSTIGSINNSNPVEQGIYKCTDKIQIETQKPFVYKQHFIKDDQINNDKIIFLLRDYKEVIVKQHFDENLSQFTEDFKNKHHKKYIALLAKYDLWTFDNMLIYYEDLIDIKKFPGILKQLLEFLGFNINITNFMQHYEKHKKECIRIYQEHIGTSSTKGKKEKFHSEKLKDYVVYWDIFLKNKYPGLFEKYLKRYEI